MKQARSGWLTILGSSAIAALCTLALAWPTDTLADAEDGGTAKEEGVPVDGVMVTGTVEREVKSATGWVLAIEAENPTNDEATADLESVITRQISSTMARVGPRPTVMWRKKDKLTVAAHGKTTRRYDVPASLAGYMTQVEKADEAWRIPMERGEDYTMPTLRTTFAVQFKGPWADPSWENFENYSKGKYGDSMPMAMPPSPLMAPGDIPGF
jgi:hypothetical protein